MPAIPELIARKRDGKEHSRAELQQLLSGASDEQLAAWLMAVYLRGMRPRETAALTEVLAASGEQIDLGDLPRTVDKHSTGGVGDKTTLVLAPLLAALGFTVAKMSGRALAHTGGTIDKLESIPGWRAELSEAEFLAQARDCGLVVAGQSRDLAPADGRLYALRDATATVDSVPLIASSVLSKKLAAGAQVILLDVKVGRGAFMPTLRQAKELALLMVEIGRRAGRRVRVLVTDMDAPLGRASGNALEVREAVAALRGEGPADLVALCCQLAGEALLAYGASPEEAQRRPPEALASGEALARFRSWIAAQGGDPRYVDSPELLEVAPGRSEIRAEQAGTVTRVDALAVGQAVLRLGGGRLRKGAPLDRGVGVEVLACPGAQVEAGTPLLRIYHREDADGLLRLGSARETLRGAVQLGQSLPRLRPLIRARLPLQRR
jgi:pyrimidine-nucleoside phosphorylase/thymidine phosphorylase